MSISSSFSDFLDALKRRHDFFHEMGGRLSDHGLNACFADFCTESAAATIFEKARSGKAATSKEQAQFATFLMLLFRPARRRKGLDQADPPRRAPQQQHAPVPPTRARHRLRLHRRLAAGRRAGRLPRPPRSRKRAAQDHPLQPQSGRQLRARHHDRQLPGRPHRRARSSSAAAGGSSIRRKPWSGR